MATPAAGAPGFDLAPFADEIRDEIRLLCTLQFRDAELAYLRSMRFIKSDFVDFLGLFSLNEKYITVTSLPTRARSTSRSGVPGCTPSCSRSRCWPSSTRCISAIPASCRIWWKGVGGSTSRSSSCAQAELVDLKIADYGTRRRFSRAWQEEVLRVLVARLGTHPATRQRDRGMPGQFAGTSNVLLAMKLGLTPLGTMAHEYLQACQALGPRLRDSQIYGFETWAKEYRGDLGIALSDVYGLDAFLRDFDMYFCKLFDGARHDSGDPFQWGERLLAHYARNRVDPRTKTLIFSDSLTVPRTIELYQQFRGRCQLAFGIGTNLTNDLGYEPLQIVIKMVRCNGQPVAKLSDTPSKNMCDDERYLAYLRQVFEIPQEA